MYIARIFQCAFPLKISQEPNLKDKHFTTHDVISPCFSGNSEAVRFHPKNPFKKPQNSFMHLWKNTFMCSVLTNSLHLLDSIWLINDQIFISTIISPRHLWVMWQLPDPQDTPQFPWALHATPAAAVANRHRKHWLPQHPCCARCGSNVECPPLCLERWWFGDGDGAHLGSIREIRVY